MTLCINERTFMKKLFLLSTLLILGCTSSNPVASIQEYDYPQDKSIKWNQSFSINEPSYYLYFYSLNCKHCKSVKNELVTYYYSHNDSFYFINCDEYSVCKQDPEKIIGINNVYDLYIIGTPTLLKLDKQIVTEYYGGETMIRNFVINK